MSATLRRAVLLPALAAALLAASGCAYLRHRAEDFAEIADVGLTVSRKPQWAFYNSFESLAAGGYADYEATFIGWGGGQFGATRHYLKAWGALVWGDERVGWGDYDVDEPGTLYEQTVGLVGMPAGMATGRSTPHYVPT
jgi:hypothetical protein